MDKLIIFKKTYELLLWIYPILEGFPKNQRFVLAQQIFNSLLEFLKFLIEANSARQKMEILRKASVSLDQSRLLIRLAKDLRLMNIKKYEASAEKINEIGKMLGGLIKKFNS